MVSGNGKWRVPVTNPPRTLKQVITAAPPEAAAANTSRSWKSVVTAICCSTVRSRAKSLLAQPRRLFELAASEASSICTRIFRISSCVRPFRNSTASCTCSW